MHPFRYSDKHISENEFMFALPAIIIGISVLTIPAQIAKVTSFSDGWISILITSILVTLISLIGLKVAMAFPNKPFFDYTSFLVTKPIAYIIISIFIFSFIAFLSYLVGLVSFVTQRYLFIQTPFALIVFFFFFLFIFFFFYYLFCL